MMPASKTQKANLPNFLTNQRFFFSLGLCTLCIGILYYTIFGMLVYDWQHLPDFSHGFLIPVISAYIIWEQRYKLDTAVVSPKNWGILIILLGMFILFIGNLAIESFTMRTSLIILLAGIILFLLGWSFFKILAFPLVFLQFMIPIPSIFMVKITFPLQLFASRISADVIDLIGIPVLREGNIITLANTTLEVAEACSGIRSLMALLALGAVFAYFSKRKMWQKIVLFFSCIPIAIFVNIFRITATAFLAHHYGSGVAEGIFHDFTGYLTYIIALGVLLGLNFLFARLGRNEEPIS